MDSPPTVACADGAAWRAWLAAHHSTATVIWLVFLKKHTGEPCVRYEEAVEEALCFGWIDSIVRRIDDRSYMQKFTPRKDTSKWSATNRRRLRKVVAEGRMTPAGLAVVGSALEEPIEQPVAPIAAPTQLPPALHARLQAVPAAWATYQGLAPSHRRQYVAWITQAKRDETRQRRLEEAIERLSHGLPLGLK